MTETVEGKTGNVGQAFGTQLVLEEGFNNTKALPSELAFRKSDSHTSK